MIISGEEFIDGFVNKSCPYSTLETYDDTQVSRNEDTSYAVSFKGKDRIQIKNSLLESMGWSKKDSNSYLEIIESYIHDGYIIDYRVNQSSSPEYYPRVISPYGKAIISPDSDNYEPLESLSSMYRYVIDLIKLEEQMDYE